MSVESSATVFRLLGNYEPTPLVELPQLALRQGVAQVLVKDESRRPLGSFKSLGGMYAGLRALARAAHVPSIQALIEARLPSERLPRLLCASDGNHGLAVATGAALVGAPARVYLHAHVPPSRAQRIAARGAEIVWIDGTYDDSVDAALAAAGRGEGLLIADTSSDPDDPVVNDVMHGYGLMAEEIHAQLVEQCWLFPTHLFVQAGVGGLAAALAAGLNRTADTGCQVVVVEPEAVACVGMALRSGRIERMTGELHTAAEMLSCGEASAPALRVLLAHHATAVTVNEASLQHAVEVLAECGGPATTPSGATGLAGCLSTPLASESRVLLISSEGPLAANE